MAAPVAAPSRLGRTTALAPHWFAAWRDLGLPAPASTVLDDLIRGWSESHRKYHALQHLHECLALFECECALAGHPGEVAIALWFHDAVHDTRRHDNEAESAAWAVRVVRQAGASQAVADRLHALIMATRHDEVPATTDERLLVDTDLAILGAGPARFAEYERQIREEYDFVPEALFRAKRTAILQGFLARPALYATPALADRFEAQARANLAAAIASLA